MNSNHVIQKILTSVSEEKREGINNLIIDNAAVLTTDVNGVCVVRIFYFLLYINYITLD